MVSGMRDGGRVLTIESATDGPASSRLGDLPRCDQWTQLTLPSSSWSPDGKSVTYVRDSTTIVEQPLAGGSPRVAARLGGQDRVIDLSWSPDGSRLVTSRGRYPNDMVIIKGLR
jgi:Tol biopolymer transport system component